MMAWLYDWAYAEVWLGGVPYRYRFRSQGDAEAFQDHVYRVAEEDGMAEAVRWLDDIAALYGGACSMSAPRLASKLAQVMAKVKYIQKRGKNTHFGYTYATEADVADKVREALAELKVAFIPRILPETIQVTPVETKAGRQIVLSAVFEFDFVDGDTGETYTVRVPGQGQDSGDKAAYKALTGAVKYALMKTFLIPTGDDPEEETEEETADQEQSAPARAPAPAPVPQARATELERATQPQINHIFALARGLGWDNELLHEEIAQRYNKDSLRLLTKAEASDMIDYLRSLSSIRVPEEAGRV